MLRWYSGQLGMPLETWQQTVAAAINGVFGDNDANHLIEQMAFEADLHDTRHMRHWSDIAPQLFQQARRAGNSDSRAAQSLMAIARIADRDNHQT